MVSVAKELGINESLIHKWKRAALTKGDGRRSRAEISEIETLKKRNRELEQENEILKKGGTRLRQRILKRCKFINDEKQNYPLKLLCRVMQVSSSGYYAFRKPLTKLPCPKKNACLIWCEIVMRENRRRYDTRRTAVKVRWNLRSNYKQKSRNQKTVFCLN